MSHFVFLSTLLQSADDGLTWEDIVASLPLDPVSLFALAVVLVFLGVVLWFGREGGGGGKKSA